MTRLTSVQLEKLREEGDWKALWAASVPWVKFAASSLRTDEREDLIQDGLLEVGRQVKNWEPARGRFSTFICNVARTSMLKHIMRKNRRREVAEPLHDGDTSVGNRDSAEGGTLWAPTYRDTDHTPEGFGAPETELAREYSQTAAEQLLLQLEASDSLLLREYFGLPILDDPAESRLVKDIAASRGLPQQTFSSRVAIAQKRLGESRNRGYVGTMSANEATYPPEGRKSWRTNQPADRRHPGFYHGIASAMGDTDAWRESVGSVWNDWSWKPTDQDIINGAKP